MREILFKAKRVDNGEWVEGFYVSWSHMNGVGYEYVHAIQGDHVPVLVIPETVCQFIGKRDRNGRRIFDGDEVACHKHGVVTEEHIRGFVKWGEYTMQHPGYEHNEYYSGYGPFIDGEYIYNLILVEDVVLTGRNIHDTTGETE